MKNVASNSSGTLKVFLRNLFWKLHRNAQEFKKSWSIPISGSVVRLALDINFFSLGPSSKWCEKVANIDQGLPHVFLLLYFIPLSFEFDSIACFFTFPFYFCRRRCFSFQVAVFPLSDRVALISWFFSDNSIIMRSSIVEEQQLVFATPSARLAAIWLMDGDFHSMLQGVRKNDFIAAPRSILLHFSEPILHHLVTRSRDVVVHCDAHEVEAEVEARMI